MKLGWIAMGLIAWIGTSTLKILFRRTESHQSGRPFNETLAYRFDESDSIRDLMECGKEGEVGGLPVVHPGRAMKMRLVVSLRALRTSWSSAR